MLPPPRGPISRAVGAFLLGGRPLPDPDEVLAAALDPLVDDDLHLALWCCYELHHHGFAEVGERLEWNPALLSFRQRLEQAFEDALRTEFSEASLPADPVTAIRVIGEWSSPPLAAFVEDMGTVDHLREFAIHRSAYQLKEADAHTFAIPRLSGTGRSAMIEIQFDEYGEGRPGAAHADLFASAMRELELHDDLGHYVGRLPGTTLATDNLVEMFGLHRRLRGALVGHLALFETTSVTPMSRYLSAVRRIGDLPAMEKFYEVHVEADAHHGRLATSHMVAGVIDGEPALGPDVIFGAAALNRVEGRFASHLLGCWRDGRSSLLDETSTPHLSPPTSPTEAAPHPELRPSA